MTISRSAQCDGTCGKLGITLLVVALTALWGAVAFAAVNEDLIEGAKGGKLPVVQRLITKGADVNAMDGEGATALMYASLNGHRGVVEALLAKGAEVNVRDKYGLTALMLASQQDENLEIVKALLAKGADVNAFNEDGATALMLAAGNGFVEVVKALLEKGAEVERERSGGINGVDCCLRERPARGRRGADR